MDGQGNKLQIKSADYNDSGNYVCTATNVLGQARKVVKLLVEGKHMICWGRMQRKTSGGAHSTSRHAIMQIEHGLGISIYFQYRISIVRPNNDTKSKHAKGGLIYLTVLAI